MRIWFENGWWFVQVSHMLGKCGSEAQAKAVGQKWVIIFRRGKILARAVSSLIGTK